jgi:hypothetical protein
MSTFVNIYISKVCRFLQQWKIADIGQKVSICKQFLSFSRYAITLGTFSVLQASTSAIFPTVATVGQRFLFWSF